MRSKKFTVMALVAAIAAAASVGALALSGPSGATQAPNPIAATATPVIMVHGYVPTTCPGMDVTKGEFGGVYLKLSWAGWTGPLLPVSFYKCDVDGVDITGYGPTIPAGATTSVTNDPTRVPYDQDTPIEQIAHDLAWFIYDNYASAGTPVDLVGMSLGGLVIRYALYRVGVGDPNYPPYLYVPRALTISAPHAGYETLENNSTLCQGHTECNEYARDSAFMTDLTANALDPQGAGGTVWTLLGSENCDVIPVGSTLAMPAAYRVDYTNPCYTHASYLWDWDSTTDAVATVRPPNDPTAIGYTAAPRSLDWIVQTMINQPGYLPPLTPPSSSGTATSSSTSSSPTPTSSSPTPTSSSPTPTSSSPTPTSSSPTPTSSSSTPTSSSPTPTSSSPAPTSSSSGGDTTPPTAQLSVSGPKFSVSRSISLSYQAADTGSGVDSYDVRYRTVSWASSTYSPYSYPTAWQDLTTTVLTATGTAGHENCYSVRARDKAGNVSKWTADQCVVIPLDDRGLTTVTSNWQRSTDSGAFAKTVTQSTARGARLRLTGVYVTRLALVVIECPTCGKIDINLNGTLWRTVDTYGSTTREKVVLLQPGFTFERVSIGFVNADGKRVAIDGLDVAHT